MNDTKRCDHLACICTVPIAQAFCSEFCGSREAQDPANVKCECGHPKCAAEMTKELEGKM